MTALASTGRITTKCTIIIKYFQYEYVQCKRRNNRIENTQTDEILARLWEHNRKWIRPTTRINSFKIIYHNGYNVWRNASNRQSCLDEVVSDEFHSPTVLPAQLNALFWSKDCYSSSRCSQSCRWQWGSEDKSTGIWAYHINQTMTADQVASEIRKCLSRKQRERERVRKVCLVYIKW